MAAGVVATGYAASANTSYCFDSAFDKEEQQLIVGLYRPNGNRIPVLDEAKREIDDYWQLQLP